VGLLWRCGGLLWLAPESAQLGCLPPFFCLNYFPFSAFIFVSYLLQNQFKSDETNF
jgi:hypothetical protein